MAERIEAAAAEAAAGDAEGAAAEELKQRATRKRSVSFRPATSGSCYSVPSDACQTDCCSSLIACNDCSKLSGFHGMLKGLASAGLKSVLLCACFVPAAFWARMDFACFEAEKVREGTAGATGEGEAAAACASDGEAPGVCRGRCCVDDLPAGVCMARGGDESDKSKEREYAREGGLEHKTSAHK